MKKMIIAAATLAVCMTGIFAYTGRANDISMGFTFDNGILPDWEPLYNNADMSIEKEENENKYLKLSYNGNANRGREYFDVSLDPIYPKGILQVDYDVMYPEDIELGGSIQLKRMQGPGEDATDMVARVAVEYGYFRTQDKTGGLYSVVGVDGQKTAVEAGKWYSVKLIVDFEKAKQVLYIFDRDTEELLVYTEARDTVEGNTSINRITFSGRGEMCIDNVRIYNTRCEKLNIYGPPYAEKAQKNSYYLFGETSGGDLTAPPMGDVTWSLEYERENISVDSDTRRLITGSSPEPGPAVLRADVEGEEGTMTARYIVNVSR